MPSTFTYISITYTGVTASRIRLESESFHTALGIGAVEAFLLGESHFARRERALAISVIGDDSRPTAERTGSWRFENVMDIVAEAWVTLTYSLAEDC